jgi:hypothetical protein
MHLAKVNTMCSLHLLPDTSAELAINPHLHLQVNEKAKKLKEIQLDNNKFCDWSQNETSALEDDPIPVVENLS